MFDTVFTLFNRIEEIYSYAVLRTVSLKIGRFGEKVLGIYSFISKIERYIQAFMKHTRNKSNISIFILEIFT